MTRPFQRQPALAAVLGLIQPGLGHVYAGQFLRGATVLAIILIFTAAQVLVLVNGVVGRWVPLAGLIALLIYVGQAVDAMRVARGAPIPYVPKSYNTAFTYASVLVVGLATGRLSSWIKEHYVEAFRVPSDAMSETIRAGDWLYVDKRSASRGLQTRNALVVYLSPDDSSLAIKRVVGISGDTLRMVNDTLFRNDRRVDEPFARLGPATSTALDDTALYRMRNWGPVIVNHGTLFVLGDNRHASKDSRHVGLIPVENVVGTPSVVYYSYDPEGDLPFRGLTAIRWERLGLALR